MANQADGEWSGRYDRSLANSRDERELSSFGPRPAQEPEWFGRRGLLPFALRRDHVVVLGDGDLDGLTRRTEAARSALKGFVTPNFDGSRLTIRSHHSVRGDWLYPMFSGRAVEHPGGVKVVGELRPGPLAWPMVLLTLTMPLAALVPGVHNRLLLAAMGSAIFIVFNWGLVLGRKRNRHRRAQIVMAVEDIGGGAAQLQTRRPLVGG